jgi:phage FluMu protein Com
VFEMAALIHSLIKCEVCSVVRFLNAKGEGPTEIHKQIVAVYGSIMNQQKVTKWEGLMFMTNKGAVGHL